VSEKLHDSVVKFDMYQNLQSSHGPLCDSMALVLTYLLNYLLNVWCNRSLNWCTYWQ